MRRSKPAVAVVTTILAYSAIAGLGSLPEGIEGSHGHNHPAPPPVSLKRIAVPEPPQVAEFVRDRAAAIRLGKALFWDMQTGSDGIQACATCHFHAGADPRLKNQTGPGSDGVFASGAGPNATLTPADFPFLRFADPADRRSRVVADRDDVASSQGLPRHAFAGLRPGSAVERGRWMLDAASHVGGVNVRRVAGRNTPTVINAVFNFRNFWDGRAQDEFNGVNALGDRDPNARVLKVVEGRVVPVRVRFTRAGLASQAVAPPVLGLEDGYEGRTFLHLGRKLLALRPLAKQLVHPHDSVLGAVASSHRAAGRRGLETSYRRLIQEAFRREWWDWDGSLTQNGETMALMEANFALFWGLAIQLYESTLVSDDTPFDRFRDGDPTALTTTQKHGFDLFMGKGRCVTCHEGAEFTSAATRSVRATRLERMKMGDGGEAVYDNGFYNIGVRPTWEDRGLGGTDAFGRPLSDARMARAGNFAVAVDYTSGRARLGAREQSKLLAQRRPTHRIVADGCFKTPTLRNVELTAPYFHNGGQATLRQVLAFYNRGGDFAEANRADLSPDIKSLRLSSDEAAALHAFLLGLTDERVRYQRAPFDHPELFVPDGHAGDHRRVTNNGRGVARDRLRWLPAVGAAGGPKLKPVFP